MPFLPDVTDVFRVSCRGSNAGAPWANVFHVRAIGEGDIATDAQLDTFASDFADAYDGHLLEHIENEVQLTDIVVTDLTSTTSGQGRWNGSKAGDYSGQPYPAQVAVVISWRQAFRYRGGHPRTYLPGIPLAAGADNRTLSPTYVAAYLSDGAGFLTAVNGLTIGGTSTELGMVTYYSKPLFPTPPHLRTNPIFYPFTAAAVHGRLDTQRRRLGREA